jgi:hypothetical protein
MHNVLLKYARTADKPITNVLKTKCILRTPDTDVLEGERDGMCCLSFPGSRSHVPTTDTVSISQTVSDTSLCTKYLHVPVLRIISYSSSVKSWKDFTQNIIFVSYTLKVLKSNP